MSAQRLPLPADWHTLAPGRTEPDLSEHYGRSTEVIQRWRRESGIAPTRRGPDRDKRRVKGVRS